MWLTTELNDPFSTIAIHHEIISKPFNQSISTIILEFEVEFDENCKNACDFTYPVQSYREINILNAFTRELTRSLPGFELTCSPKMEKNFNFNECVLS